MPADNRLQIRLEADVAEALSHVEDPRAYVQDLVRHRRRQWQAAYLLLTTSGWTPQELLAACDALNGHSLLEDLGGWPGGAGVPLELHDAQRLRDLCGKWGIDPARWAAHVERLAQAPEEREAVALLARELWAGSGELERRLRG
jgi:hypothetical protein